MNIHKEELEEMENKSDWAYKTKLCIAFDFTTAIPYFIDINPERDRVNKIIQTILTTSSSIGFRI